MPARTDATEAGAGTGHVASPVGRLQPGEQLQLLLVGQVVVVCRSRFHGDGSSGGGLAHALRVQLTSAEHTGGCAETETARCDQRSPPARHTHDTHKTRTKRTLHAHKRAHNTHSPAHSTPKAQPRRQRTSHRWATVGDTQRPG